LLYAGLYIVNKKNSDAKEPDAFVSLILLAKFAYQTLKKRTSDRVRKQGKTAVELILPGYEPNEKRITKITSL
jgi:hypothetical protein